MPRYPRRIARDGRPADAVPAPQHLWNDPAPTFRAVLQGPRTDRPGVGPPRHEKVSSDTRSVPVFLLS
ncbi:MULTISPECIES: hypothetical protein [Streptomyces]|uniref:hypothetical protein n=1 Tax=Streptomyces TaxID=1883 RepID=UPI00148859C0|nr:MULTISPECIES: hypothetical protein [Streptomyces]